MKQRIFRVVMAFLLAFSICVGLLPPAFAGSGKVTFTGIDTLMIYNPMTDYVDMASYSTLSTGNMYGQIRRTEGNFSAVDTDVEDVPFRDIGPGLWEQVSGFKPVISGPADETESLRSRAAVGSTKSFFYWPDQRSSYQMDKADFTCLYVGDHCLVWGYEFSDGDMAQTLGEEFDDLIYENNTAYFGTGRFLEDGDKLNMLVYTMNVSSLAGFFWGIELYDSEEQGDLAGSYNAGMPIIHINTAICTDADDQFARYGATTVAHEYQHLICMSSTLLGNGYMDGIVMGTWLNEAMAKEAEELSYPGMVVRNRYVSGSYNGSDDIGGGQSLYNFTTYYDIGVYGQGFLFSEYIKQLYGGAGVYKKIHDYWRTADAADLTDAAALCAALPQSVRAAILDQLEYPAAVTDSFGGEEEEFLSKLNLAFQIACALKEDGGIYGLPDSCGEASPKLYTDSRCDIECGGRIFVKTADGDSYTVPADADSKLIYVGFKNGEMVIAPTTAAGYLSSAFTVQAVSNDPALGTVSVSGNVITARPAEGCGFDAPAWTLLSGTARVEKKGNTFTVYPEEDCTVQINFRRRSQTVDVWDGTVAESVPVSGDIYVIETCAQLAKLAQMVNGGEKLAGKTVQLANDLDLNGHQWTPIGKNNSYRFSGSFEGCGYTVSGLTIGTADVPRDGNYHGLFGYVSGAGSAICDLNLDRVSVYGKSYAGALVGYYYDGAVVNCSASGTVSGDSYIGLLMGYASALEVSHCGTDGAVAATTDHVGGIVASMQNSTMKQCRSGASVTGGSNVGGLVGRLSGSITDCYSRGTVSGESAVGGLVGYTTGSNAMGGAVAITNCYWAGRLTADGSKGGIVGSYLGELSCTSCYYDEFGCDYAAADGARSGVTALDPVELQDRSSYSGWDFDSVWNLSRGANDSYPILRWQVFDVSQVLIRGDRHWLYPGETMQLTLLVLPDVAEDTAYTVTSSDPAVLTVSDAGLVTAKTAGEAVITLTANSNGTEAVYDVAVITEELIAGGFSGGTGTESDPYLVSNKADLEHLARIAGYGYTFSGEYIRQTIDIDLAGTDASPWTPIGTSGRPFSGVYEGGGRQISGLYLEGAESPAGLFGVISGGSLSHLVLADSIVSGGSMTGAFVGMLTDGVLKDCCALSDVTVSGTGDVGGIVGSVIDSGGTTVIALCSNGAAVSGSGMLLRVGGIAGNVTARGALVDRCRNSGSVSAGGVIAMTGGLIGMAGNTVVLRGANSGSVTGSGATGGIVGYLSTGSYVTDTSNAGVIRNSSNPSGGIVGTAEEGTGILQSCNIASVAAKAEAHSIVGVSLGATVAACYYLDTVAADGAATARTSVQMKNRDFLAGFDFEKTWSFVAGENSGYPVLRAFHPTVSVPAGTFDKYVFSAEYRNVTVTFSGIGGELTGLMDGDGKNVAVVSDSEAGVHILTLSADWLATLPVGTHTLYARFAAHCAVPFTVTVTDSTPDQYEVMPTEVSSTSDSTTVKLVLSAPEEMTATVVLAAYREGKLESVNALTEVLTYGRNELKLTLDIAVDEALRYVVFLASEAGYVPLMRDFEFAFRFDSAASVGAGESLQVQILADGPM